LRATDDEKDEIFFSPFGLRVQFRVSYLPTEDGQPTSNRRWATEPPGGPPPGPPTSSVALEKNWHVPCFEKAVQYSMVRRSTSYHSDAQRCGMTGHGFQMTGHDVMTDRSRAVDRDLSRAPSRGDAGWQEPGARSCAGLSGCSMSGFLPRAVPTFFTARPRIPAPSAAAY
jgi:hypothetical protein